jgi:hypothetical protein
MNDIEQDAARYRYLVKWGELFLTSQAAIGHNALYSDDPKEVWDAAIDAAMGEAPIPYFITDAGKAALRGGE